MSSRSTLIFRLAALLMLSTLVTGGCRKIADYYDYVPVPPDAGGGVEVSRHDAAVHGDGKDAAPETADANGDAGDGDAVLDARVVDMSPCACNTSRKCKLVIDAKVGGTLIKKTSFKFSPPFVKVTYGYNRHLDVGLVFFMGINNYDTNRIVLVFDVKSRVSKVKAMTMALRLCLSKESEGKVVVGEIKSPDPVESGKINAEKYYHPSSVHEVSYVDGKKKDNIVDEFIFSGNAITSFNNKYMNGMSPNYALMIVSSNENNPFIHRAYHAVEDASGACQGHPAPTLTIEYCTN